MRFYLGTHCPNWLELTDVPLFISRRRLAGRRTLPRALGPWVLDSGGYTELHQPAGRWSITTRQYAAEVRRYADEIGSLAWVAPMDWMCEPNVLANTGLSVEAHQMRTLVNFERLRHELGRLVAPVLQGWTEADYLEHALMYECRGYDLNDEPIIGVGSICRRGDWQPIARIVRLLNETAPYNQLHAFGVKGEALLALSDVLTSADSMAWSFAARRSPPLVGCAHSSCANCLRYALAWRARIVESLGQTRIEVPA